MKTIIIVLLIILLSGFVWGVYYYFSTRGVVVDIQNRSHGELTNLVLEFTGGRVRIDRISSGEHAVKRINPTGESSFTINYNSGDKNYTQKADVYLEHNYTGSLTITLQDDGKMTYHSQITP